MAHVKERRMKNKKQIEEFTNRVKSVHEAVSEVWFVEGGAVATPLHHLMMIHIHIY